MARSNNNRQIPIGDPRPIGVGTCRSKVWWIFAVAVVVGMPAMGLAIWGSGVPGRVKTWMGTSLPIRWRRLKLIIGLK
jgi:hypothetical protein